MPTSFDIFGGYKHRAASRVPARLSQSFLLECLVLGRTEDIAQILFSNGGRDLFTQAPDAFLRAISAEATRRINGLTRRFGIEIVQVPGHDLSAFLGCKPAAVGTHRCRRVSNHGSDFHFLQKPLLHQIPYEDFSPTSRYHPLAFRVKREMKAYIVSYTIQTGDRHWL